MRSRTAAVHRSLLVRTGAATLLLALAVGGGAWWMASRELEGVILERTRVGVEILRQGVERRLAAGEGPLASALTAELEHPAVTLPAASAGQFVALLLLDGDGVERLRSTRPGSGAVPWEPLLAPARSGRLVVHGRSSSGGRSRVALAAPFEPRGGAAGGEIRGWFELSEEALAALAGRTRRSAATAAALILLTAAVLYPIVRRLLERQVRLAADLLDANLETLATLGSAIAKRDNDTDAHNFRVVVYSVRLAEALGQSEELVRQLIKGAFIHDVGKIGIRDAVLLKPGRLDEAELAEMRRHVEHGLEIVGRSRWLAEAAPVVGGHHEKFDGRGYPRGFAAGSIPLAARLFALADVFDAVTSDRPYHRPKSLEETLELLEAGRGTHFDPALLDAFVAIAPGLHAAFANRAEEPRREAMALLARYFRESPGALAG